MGEVINRTAAIADIEADVRTTLRNATARGGEVGAAAETRFAEIMPKLDDCRQQLDLSSALVENSYATFMVTDKHSDLTIGAVLDEIWNTLGRPAKSPDFAAIAAGGKNTWADGDPTQQPMRMQILANNLAAATHPTLQARKAEWVERITTAATAQKTAANPYVAASTTHDILDAQWRVLVGFAHVALTRFKRDLKNLGLTEAQIHEIIPDRPRPTKPKTEA